THACPEQRRLPLPPPRPAPGGTPPPARAGGGGAGQQPPHFGPSYLEMAPDPDRFWFPPVLNVALVPNLDDPVLSQLPVRQAIAYALDKGKISSLGEGGEQGPANQNGIITPTYQSWVDSSLPDPTNDPAKAQQILNSAGYKKGSDGIYQSPSGKKLSF